MKKTIGIVLLCLQCAIAWAQGYNHAWLMGYGSWVNKGRIMFDSTGYQFNIEQRKMSFLDTQGNISDANGNFLMSSNGVWIANATGDTMLNGSGLNPNSYTNNWSNYGLPLSNGNLIVPWPDDTTRYVLFHQTGNYDPNYLYASRELYYSIINMQGDSGRGEVIQKNTIIFQDSLAWGLGACRHANGRDWWIVALSDKGNGIHTVLLNPSGIQYWGYQQFPFPSYYAIATQPSFSPDGSKFAFTSGIGNAGLWTHSVCYLDFDRCSGVFTNPVHVDITDSVVGLGVAFSPNSKYLFVCKFDKILQFNTDTSDIGASMQTVAINDGFYSPSPPFQTDFWLMYLAANGKIYLTSGNGVQHIHLINTPDMSGLACDVQQHALSLNGVYHSGSVPNHPNYYLGCDTTLGCPCLITTGISEHGVHDFKFSIAPNPNNGAFKIIYLLPQNKAGRLEVFDITGKVVYQMSLPQWSTLQQIELPQSLSNGLYSCVITSDGYRQSKKVAVVR